MRKFQKEKNSQTSPATPGTDREALAQVAEQTPTVCRYLTELKLKPVPLGGVDEADVWKKLEKLCQFYEEAFYAERVQRQKLENAMAALRATAGREESQ